MVDLSQTIIAKSDQLNADDLLSGDLQITVTKVEVQQTDQPVLIHYQGDNGRPYKPCLSMRRVLTHLWGKNGNDYVGRSMVLYRDPDVKWAGQPVGGIRIKAMSHIDRTATLQLAVTRGKKKTYTVTPLKTKPAAVQYYPDANFNNLKTRIQGYIESGEKTAKEIIQQLNARAKLTDAQIEFINSFVFNAINDAPDDDPLDDFDAPETIDAPEAMNAPEINDEPETETPETEVF